MSGNAGISAAERPAARRLRSGQRGMALMTVLVFSFIFVLGVAAFFTVAAYEANRAEIGEHSTRAFFLADGAIERAKGELLQNARWETGYAWTASDGGRYRLAVSDTVFQGATRKRFYAEGQFQRSKRDVEVIANIVPPGYEIAILILGDIDIKGNICLDGGAHANGTITGGQFITCGGTYDDGYVVKPPVVYTEPDSFPGATYYYVTAEQIGGARWLYIKDRNGNTLSSYRKGVSSPHPDFSDWDYNQGKKTLTFNYKPSGGAPRGWDENSGPFQKLGADTAVVVNFGSTAAWKSKHAKTNMEFQETGNYEVPTTIINSRFEGISVEDRLDKTKWTGGLITTKTKSYFAPTLCIDMVADSLDGTAQANLGTAAHPALTYVMEDVNFAHGQWSITGTLICLGDMTLAGGNNLTYNRAFIGCLPPSLRLNWPVGTSGVMEILQWREPAPKAST